MKKHIGSTIALWIGVLYGLSGLTRIVNPEQGGGDFWGGIIVILGALAYRSAKKRKLGEVKSSSVRKANEVGAIISMLAIVLLQTNLPNNIIDNPFPNLIIPLWAIVAYIVIVLKKQKAEKSEPNESVQPLGGRK